MNELVVVVVPPFGVAVGVAVSVTEAVGVAVSVTGGVPDNPFTLNHLYGGYRINEL
jgi:hypothetical protein